MRPKSRTGSTKSGRANSLKSGQSGVMSATMPAGGLPGISRAASAMPSAVQTLGQRTMPAGGGLPGDPGYAEIIRAASAMPKTGYAYTLPGMTPPQHPASASPGSNGYANGTGYSPQYPTGSSGVQSGVAWEV
jgi:hypothetical protein